MILREATATAAAVIKAIGPLCVRCEAVGAVRRQHDTEIKVVEIVAIPNVSHLMALRDVINSRWGPPSAGPFPSKFTKIRRVVPLDFHWVNAAQWGLAVFMLTGPTTFVQPALQRWKREHEDMGCERDFRLYQSPELEPMKIVEEMDVFQCFEAEFVKPEERRWWR